MQEIHYIDADALTSSLPAGRAKVRLVSPDVPLLYFVLHVDLDGHVAAMEIHSHAPGGLRAEHLRSVPLAEMQRAARKKLVEYVTEDRALPTFHVPPTVVAHAATAIRDTARPGRAGRDMAEYLAIAAEYDRLVDEVKNPIQVLAKQFFVGEPQMSQLIYRLKRPPFNLLSKGKRGKAGGKLTDKAKALLSHEGGR